MPPFVPRKRHQSPELPTPPIKRTRAKPTPKQEKTTLFATFDAPASRRQSGRRTEKVHNLPPESDGDEDESSAISDLDSDEFEDVPPTERRDEAATKHVASNSKHHGGHHESSEEEEMDWEDAIGDETATQSDVHQPTRPPLRPSHEIGDISISLNDDGSYVDAITAMAATRKGPSKRERQARIHTHCLHVQALMWHNTIRNSWANDKQVQKTLVDGLTDGVKREVAKWKHAMGKLSKEELRMKKENAAAAKGRGKDGKVVKVKRESHGRDWNYDAEHLEHGVPDLSRGDPLLRLMKVLTAYWRKKFFATAPGLRKQGYMPLKRLREEVKDWEKNRLDAEQHGERVENVKAFRELAKICEGSRDIGALLFVALLRGLGIETRLVANLQPAGIGFSKSENAAPKRMKKDTRQSADDQAIPPVPQTPSKRSKPPTKSKLKAEEPTRVSARGNKADPITFDDTDDSPLSDAPSELEEPAEKTDDDLSVIDLTPIVPARKSYKKYDRDLSFPHYWAEVCSPISNRYFPVDPIVLSTIASNDELLMTFEPRGKNADLSKQVICYTIAFSADGSAKDVTVRYLKKHQLPGKTKGMRVMVEKIPIYNHRGKIKKYEEYDWFGNIMSIYNRRPAKRTAADKLEDETDLKPFQALTTEKQIDKESLQWYKQSADYVLETHLRREEALLPSAKPVRTFVAGKGDKTIEHEVYLRSDVVTCRTVESWHKEGRAVKTSEQPIKHVPVRAVTLIRKGEIEDAQRETGEKPMQGLYHIEQTEWIIPPPIVDGVIPKNAFGNMDVYVPTMVPQGAIHLPLKGTAKLCRKLGIDYAEACTGFDFGKQRAVPVLTGVVVARENGPMVKEAWREEQREIKRKEDTKRTAAALHWWRKMLMGMRIVERMRAEYEHLGGTEEEINPFVGKAKREGREVVTIHDTDDEKNAQAEDYADAGGFFAPGHNEVETAQSRNATTTKLPGEDADFGGGFLLSQESTNEPADGGFLVEDDADDQKSSQRPTLAHPTLNPISLQSLHRMNEAESDDDSDNNQFTPKQNSNGGASRVKENGKTSNPKSRRTSQAKNAKSAVVDDSDEQSSEISSALDSAPDEYIAPKKTPTRIGHVSIPRSKPSAQSARQKKVNDRQSRPPKSTPTKSQYFSNNTADEAEDDNDDDDESEVEVVKPRRTTARTSKK